MAVKTNNGWQNTTVSEWIWKIGSLADPTHYQYLSTNPNLIQNEGDCNGDWSGPMGVYVDFFLDRCSPEQRRCEICGGRYDQKDIDHDWGEWEDYIGSTRQRICKRAEPIQGNNTTHFQRCGNLSNPNNKQYFSHNFTQASYKDEMNHVSRCGRCGFEQEETHDSLGGYISSTDPTCEGFGNTGGYICSKCSYTTNVIIPPLGHDVSYFFNTTATQHQEYSYCDRCGQVTWTGNWEGHDFGNDPRYPHPCICGQNP